MKIRAFASTFALLLLGFAATTARTSAQSANGTYQFSFDDGYTKYVEFDARKQADGTATGSMMLSDEAPIYNVDVDGTGDPNQEEKIPGAYIKANFDSLVVNKNQAVMSGTITESSVKALVGLRVLLTVEDNGDNTNEPDRVTWGIYKPADKSWTPSDAELKEDSGVGMKWQATDAEIKDDEGVAMPGSDAIDTKTYPVASYAFVEVERAAGDIRVQE